MNPSGTMWSKDNLPNCPPKDIRMQANPEKAFVLHTWQAKQTD